MPDSTSVGVPQKLFDLLLNGQGEEVALNCRDTSRRLRRDDIDAYDTAIGVCSVDSNLE